MSGTAPGDGRTIAEHIRFAGPILALAAVGCAVSILGSDPRTGLDVAVRRGPLVPVEQPGVENSAPVGDASVRVRRVAETGSAEATTGVDGRVAFALAPDRYEITVRECPGALGLPRAETVRVSSGTRTGVTLLCDTGIR